MQGIPYSLRRRIGVDPVDHALNPGPQRQIGEDLHDTPLVGEGRLLEHRQVFHHAVVDDVLHDLVDKVDLSAVQIDVV